MIFWRDARPGCHPDPLQEGEGPRKLRLAPLAKGHCTAGCEILRCAQEDKVGGSVS